MAEEPINLLDNTALTPPKRTSPQSTSPQQPQPSPTTTTPAAPQIHIETLYENQRGTFIFGLPLFSPRALWNLHIDQSPWVDAKFRPSAVNITNAQVPDPSWTWAWKTWYVDMSGDVDEEGWQYSLWFRGTGWHGNRPWWHSFVRRRRWVRGRAKREVKMKGERLVGDSGSFGGSLGLARTSTFGTGLMSPSHGSGYGNENGGDHEEEEEEITDMNKLMAVLKQSAIDREKLVAIDKFIHQGGEELFYLSQQIPAIMANLIFQASRRQLLANLSTIIDSATAHRESHKANNTAENEAESRRIDNLLKAVEAADAECRKLEYWSDVKKLAREGRGINAVGESWGEGWDGLDGSAPAGDAGKM